jgi:hypothetical protein
MEKERCRIPSCCGFIIVGYIGSYVLTISLMMNRLLTISEGDVSGRDYIF